jgi:F0F1-type ATP synthase delta subunit
MTTVVTEKTLAQITHALHTQEQLTEVIAQIETCQSMLFSTKKAAQKTLESLPNLIHSLVPDAIQADEKSLDGWLSELSDQLRKIPVATVTVAYLPTAAQAEELRSLVETGFGRHVIIALQTDPKLLAGVRIEFANTRTQYSLSQDMEEILKEAHVQS